LLFSELIRRATQQEVRLGLFGLAFSSSAIWSVIFQVLRFPGLAFTVAPVYLVLVEGEADITGRPIAYSIRTAMRRTRIDNQLCHSGIRVQHVDDSTRLSRILRFIRLK